jgi:hypothetical protein
METEYEGVEVISIPRTGKRKAVTAKPKEKFVYLPKAYTGPLDGFNSVSKIPEGIFELPRVTSLESDNFAAVKAVYITNVDLRTYLIGSKLDAGKYNMDEIKAVLHLHGVTIPKGTTRKADYIALAKKSGVVKYKRS